MTSECQPNQAHSATVDRHVPIVITPDVVSSSTSEAVACFITTSVWDVRLQELAAYKEANRHTNVPQRFPSNKPLGSWVRTQRNQYKLLREGKNSHMTKERMESLNELDFEWSSGSETSTPWEQRLQELAAYKEANGNTLVPQVFPSNKQLGFWVQTQRIQFKLLQDGKKSAMTEEHIKSLNELDFVWRDVKANAEAASWDVRLQELAAYKEANGHTNVPQVFPSNTPLGSWVRTQRNQYKLLHENKKSAMTEEHIKSLNELDFNWRHPLFWSYP
jgi:glutaredoxin